MKRCSHCGSLYPDDATICPIDEMPLEQEQPQKVRRISGYFLAVPKARKIPISLLIVSYLFLLPALPSLFTMLSVACLVYLGGLPQKGSLSLLVFVGLTCASIFFWFCLSRGLRYCSRGWRICALIIIWLSFIVLSVQVSRCLLYQKLPRHETAGEFWVGSGLGFLVFIWQYWVLTRPDIRKLFYSDATENSDKSGW